MRSPLHTVSCLVCVYLRGHSSTVVDGRHIPEHEADHRLVSHVEEQASLVPVLVLQGTETKSKRFDKQTFQNTLILVSAVLLV